MDKQQDDRTRTPARPNFLTSVARHYSGSFTQVALSATSAWMIVTGLKGLAGFTVNQHTAIADLAGIAIVIGLARWIKVRYDVK